MDCSIDTPALGLTVSTAGASVRRFVAKRDGRSVPIFRESPAGDTRTALQSGCFPMVPYGNRIRGNAFSFEGATYTLSAKRQGSRDVLHGDGWTSAWRLAHHDDTRIVMRVEHRDPPASPYVYDAEQIFALDGSTLTITIAVTNRGETALPFGLGLHPFFPLTPRTTLRAAARRFWDQDAQWLPTVQHPVAGDLDFAASAPVPRRWLNTGFEGWDGVAVVTWPERDASVTMEADALFDRCLVFVSDPAVDPAYGYEFFCVEPMSHGVDGHSDFASSGLRRLAPGQRLSGQVRFTAALGPAPFTTDPARDPEDHLDGRRPSDGIDGARAH